jgi:hypothetical protein
MDKASIGGSEMRTITITVYEFHELSLEAKNYILDNLADNLIDGDLLNDEVLIKIAKEYEYTRDGEIYNESPTQ